MDKRNADKLRDENPGGRDDLIEVLAGLEGGEAALHQYIKELQEDNEKLKAENKAAEANYSMARSDKQEAHRYASHIATQRGRARELLQEVLYCEASEDENGRAVLLVPDSLGALSAEIRKELGQ